MTPIRPFAAAAAAMIVTAAPAAAGPFEKAPVACGMAVPFDSCIASFDGETLSIEYIRKGGPGAVARYRHCTTGPSLIHCAEGRWVAGGVEGQIGARGLGIGRDGRPFPP